MISEPPANQQLQTVAVDLTPVLPGGDNGGAKVFVLELLRRLGELAPQTQFVLLTQASAHEELAALDSSNIRRLLVLDRSKLPRVRLLATRIYLRVLRHLPRRLRVIAGRIGYPIMKMVKRNGSGSVLRDMHADLLFCPFTAPTYFEPTLPTVCVIYDLQYKTYPEFFSPEDVMNRDRAFMDAVRRATTLVAISDYSRHTAIAAAHLEPSQIKTIHLHVSQSSLSSAERDETILTKLGLTRQKYLIYPANFWKHKNHEMLLTAFGIARRSGLPDEVCLVCTGAPGARQQFLQQAMHALGSDKRILFPGYVTPAELLALISNSTGVIFPSLYEGFGLPVIEAMALGVPVACSNVTSLPEVAGDAAILFDPRNPEEVASAMVALTQDQPLRSRLVAAGNDRVASFSDSRLLARQYWDVFEQAVCGDQQSTILVGVTPDGWIGPRLRLQLASSSQPRRLDIELSVPKLVPESRVSVQWKFNNEVLGSKSIGRDSCYAFSVKLPPKSGFFEIRLSPTFVPAFAGYGDDQRELSAALLSCRITNGTDEPIVIFPGLLTA